TPFVIPSAQQFVPAAPPLLGSQAYADAVNKTETLGAVHSTTRTADQTQIARFWADNTGTFTPPGHWNDIAEHVAQDHADSPAAAPRLFAELNFAIADAGIVAWDTKYTYNFWRPIQAIRNADEAGNSQVQQDPNWNPLLTTPN